MLVLLVLLKLLTAVSIVSSITQGLPKLLTAISIVSSIKTITQGLHSLWDWYCFLGFESLFSKHRKSLKIGWNKAQHWNCESPCENCGTLIKCSDNICLCLSVKDKILLCSCWYKVCEKYNYNFSKPHPCSATSVQYNVTMSYCS